MRLRILPPGTSAGGPWCSRCSPWCSLACSPDHYPQTALRPLSDFARIGDDIQTRRSTGRSASSCWSRGRCSTPSSGSGASPTIRSPSRSTATPRSRSSGPSFPALILAAIAVPTVRGIFQTNAIPSRRRAHGRSHRAPVVVGVPLSGAQHHHRQRGPHPGRADGVASGWAPADVIHSFWPPRFAGKRDVFPNRETRLWFKAEQAGRVPRAVRGVLRHPARPDGVPGPGRRRRKSSRPGSPTCRRWRPGRAAPTAVRDSLRPRERRRVPARSRGAPAPAVRGQRRRTVRQGEKLFLTKGCVGCHSLNAVDAPKGLIGPNLANVGARSYIGGGRASRTPTRTSPAGSRTRRRSSRAC